MKMREVTVVRVHVPVAPETLAAMLAGDGSAGERDPVLSQVLGVIRADNPLGDFGLYRGVAEIGLGWETFQPGTDASPALGKAGEQSLSPTVTVTVHTPCTPDDPAFIAATGALLAVHPWEVPVIEIARVKLAVRNRL